MNQDKRVAKVLRCQMKKKTTFKQKRSVSKKKKKILCLCSSKIYIDVNRFRIIQISFN